MTDVAIVSAVPAVRAGLRALLQAAGHRVAGDAAHPSVDAFDVSPNVTIFDADPAAELRDVLAAAQLAPGLVLLGAVTGGVRLPAALSGRPFAYLPRDASAEQLAAAVTAVAAGLTVLDPSAAGELLVSPTSNSVENGLDSRSAPGGVDSADSLTAREREVLQLVAEGLPNKNISRRLGISEHTVKFHVASVMTKLGAASRTEAVHLAARRGAVSL